ncbi:MAG: tRNA lysidine(34) synthetase TilS [Acidimicrobiia bacterium]|nr:tRNA lysidine(34) synthetase TilS [Acidimicrobiia bacterium]
MAHSRRLAEAIRERTELPAGPLVIALSGGADSSTLAWLASTASSEVRAVFVDHGLPASHQLRVGAAAVAAQCGIQLDVVEARVDPAAPSFEDTARQARYQALLAAAKPEETVVTGHTSDDQAETVLGNVLRGAGAAGLSGIPVRRGRIHRPLLGVSREQTRALANELSLPFVDDPENESPALRRNRLRRSLIPQLESQFNPALRAALARTAAVISADDAVLEELAGRIPVVADREVVAIPAPALQVAQTAVAARAVRRALSQMRGPHGGTQEEVAAVLSVATGARKGAELTGGLRVEREGPLVVVSGEAPVPAAPVTVSESREIEFDRWVLGVEWLASPPRPRPLGTRTLLADAGVVGEELLVRPATRDDRIDIQSGTKTVADALAERGVPPRLRGRWPVGIANGQVAVIPGIRVSARARPGPNTTRYLQVNFEGRL